MTARSTEIERVRRCRLAFERAMRDGTTVLAAGRAVAQERWAAADRRLADRRCGTRSAMPAAEIERPTMWWQR